VTSPSYVATARSSSLVNTGSSCTTSTSLTLAVGDLLLVYATSPTSGNTWSVSTSGTSLTWTLVQDASVSGAGRVRCWQATATAAETVTVTLTRSAGSEGYGLHVTQWRNAQVGGSNEATNTSGSLPSVAVTTTAADSAVDVVISDYWETSGTRTWRTGAGTATEILYEWTDTWYTVYAAYHANAGAAGSKTVGLTTPTDQAYGIVGVEVKYYNPGTTIYPDAVSVSVTVPSPTLTQGNMVFPDAVSGGVTVPSPTLVPAPATIYPDAVSVTVTVGQPTIAAGTWRDVVAGPRWREAVEARSRTVGWRVELIDAVSGEWRMDLPVESGTVDFSGDDVEQWAASFTLVGEEWVPQKATDPLGPVSGLLARVWWGVGDSSGLMEIPCGTFVLEDPQVVDTSSDGAPKVAVTGRDPLSLVRATGYGPATVTLGGLTAPAALAAIMRAVAPNQPIRVDTSSSVLLPDVYEAGAAAVGKDLTTISGVAGYVCRTDREGVIVFGPTPAPEKLSADWSEGDECAVEDLERAITTHNMVNAVRVVSSNPEVDPPVTGYASDDDPSSPTFVGGPWNTRGITVQSDVVASEEAATALARSTLSGRRRPTESLRVRVPPRPDLGYRDLVALHRPAAGVGGLFRVGGWSVAITPPGEPPSKMTVKMLPRVTL